MQRDEPRARACSVKKTEMSKMQLWETKVMGGNVQKQVLHTKVAGWERIATLR